MKNVPMKRLLLYLLLTFILTYGFGLYAYGKGGIDQFPAVIPLQMFIPGVLALLVVLLYKEKPVKNVLGFHLPGLKYLSWGGLLIFLVMVSSFYISSLITTDYFLTLDTISAKLSRANIPLKLDSPIMSIAFLIFLNVVIGAIVNLPLMLGEEIGWRAFMTPRLVAYFGERGHIVAGVIWSLWHAVIIAQGFNYPGSPVLGNLLFIAYCIPVGYLFYFFYQKSGSVFVPAFLHGIMNKTAGTFMDFFVDKDKVNPLITSPAGVVGIILFSIAALAVYIYERKRVGNKPS
jgi:uncharacterized protein